MQLLRFINQNAAAVLLQAAAFVFQISALIAISAANSALAHEYWIEPVNYHPVVGNKVLANLRNGEDFEGVSFPRLPDDLVSVTRSSASGHESIPGRLGDFPAVNFIPLELGWNLATVQTQPKFLRYTETSKFNSFIQSHGFASFVNEHPDLLDDEIEVEETYTRFAKTLIHVASDANNSVTQSDSTDWTNNQLRFEWVIKQFPTLNQPIIIQLLQNNKPLPDRQVEVYKKNNGDVSRSVFKTDTQAMLTLPIVNTSDYLINAVTISRPDSAKPQITSDWASLTVSLKP